MIFLILQSIFPICDKQCKGRLLFILREGNWDCLLNKRVRFIQDSRFNISLNINWCLTYHSFVSFLLVEFKDLFPHIICRCYLYVNAALDNMWILLTYNQKQGSLRIFLLLHFVKNNTILNGSCLYREKYKLDLK